MVTKRFASNSKAKVSSQKKEKTLHQRACMTSCATKKYTGLYIFNRTVSKVCGSRNNHASKAAEDIIRIPDGMPAIISKELFSAVRKKMGNSKLNAQNKAIETYLLSGKNSLRRTRRCHGGAYIKQLRKEQNKILHLSLRQSLSYQKLQQQACQP